MHSIFRMSITRLTFIFSKLCGFVIQAKNNINVREAFIALIRLINAKSPTAGSGSVSAAGVFGGGADW